MKIRRKFIHYKLSSILLIIGFAVSFICFFNCVNLYHLLTVKKREASQYQYKSQCEIYYSNQSGNVRLEDVFQIDQGNLVIDGLNLYRDNVNGMGLADVIVSQNEEFPYPVSEGKLPKSDADRKEPVIILGRNHKRDATYKDGNYYYTIEGMQYQVCAFLGSDKSDLFDGMLMVYYDSLPEVVKDKINADADMQMTFGSDMVNTTALMGDVRKQAKTLSDRIVVSPIDTGGMSMEVSGSGDADYYFIIFLFCMINVIIVSEYWIKSRFKEIAVRKIFGYTEKKISGVLYLDMMKNAICSIGVAVIIQFILQQCFEDYLLVYKSQFWYYMAYCVLFIVLFSAIIILYPLYLMRKETVLKKMISDCM